MCEHDHGAYALIVEASQQSCKCTPISEKFMEDHRHNRARVVDAHTPTEEQILHKYHHAMPRN